MSCNMGEGCPRGAACTGYSSSRCAEAPDIGMTQPGAGRGRRSIVGGGEQREGRAPPSSCQLLLPFFWSPQPPEACGPVEW